MKVFISFQSEDVDRARVLSRELSSRGHNAILYTHRLDDPISTITPQLRRVDLLILVVGTNTRASTWVSAEILSAEVLKVPTIAILLNEQSYAPDTLACGTPITTYPALVATGFALFDIFPSRQRQSEDWQAARMKVSPYNNPQKDFIPAPVLDRRNSFYNVLTIIGLVLAFGSYYFGLFLPFILYRLYEIVVGRSNIRDVLSFRGAGVPTSVFLAWTVVFTLILFWRLYKRLPYPLWVLWFFTDYLPAWLSVRQGTVANRMKKVMERLSTSPGNRAYWEMETVRRRDGTMPVGRQIAELFTLLAEDERYSGPHGALDRNGLAEVHRLLSQIPYLDAKKTVMINRSSDEIEVIERGCPAPFCLCGRSIILKRISGRWQLQAGNGQAAAR